MFSRYLRAPLFGVLTLFLACFAAAAARAVELNPGDIVVAGDTGGATMIYRVDPATGVQTVISSEAVGSGTAVQMPTSVFFNGKGELLLSGSLAIGGAILSVDPETGDRTVVTGPGRGTGPNGSPYHLSQALADDSILSLAPVGLADVSFFRTNPMTGDRSYLPEAAFDPPIIGLPAGFSVAANGDVWQANTFPFDAIGIIRFNPDTGAHSVVSASSASEPDYGIEIVGTGPALTSSITGQTFDKNGDFYVIQPFNVLRIDPLTGDRQLVSSWDPSDLLGTGLNLGLVSGLAALPDGSLLTLNGGQLVRIDTTTGDRTLVSEFNLAEFGPVSLAVVPNPVPEPSTLALASVGALAFLGHQLRRRGASH
jgi:hypothetical protein